MNPISRPILAKQPAFSADLLVRAASCPSQPARPTGRATMDQVVIFEDDGFRNLLPLVYWRCCWDLRVGYHSLLERLVSDLGAAETTFYCRTLLEEVAAERLNRPVNRSPAGEQVLFINGRLLLLEPVRVFQGVRGSSPGVQWL
ncbi:MAG TPA: putative sugar nucleotidyl transferase, partial [Phycisphaerae bacterium]|nr:putative sugar nucleotidyl transferase [Phycisphaerae bacterium]